MKTEGLSKENIAVLSRLGNAQDIKEIASDLGLTVKGVDHHIWFMKKKLNLKNTTQLIRTAIAFGVSSLCIVLLAGCHPAPKPVTPPMPPIPPPKAKALVAPMAASTPTVPVIIAWMESPDATVKGYKLFQGTSSRNYTTILDVGKTNRAQIQSVAGKTNFYSATAYVSPSIESAYSEELVYWVKKKPHPR